MLLIMTCDNSVAVYDGANIMVLDPKILHLYKCKKFCGTCLQLLYFHNLVHWQSGGFNYCALIGYLLQNGRHLASRYSIESYMIFIFFFVYFVCCVPHAKLCEQWSLL